MHACMLACMCVYVLGLLTNANGNVSLDADSIFQECIQMQMQMFGVTLKCKCRCFGYTFANAFEVISNVLALY